MTATALADQGTPAPAATSPTAVPAPAAAATETKATAPAAPPETAPASEAAKSPAPAPAPVLDPAVVAKVIADHDAARTKQSDENFAAALAGWTDAIKADPNLGGAHYERTQARIDSVLATANIPEFTKGLLDSKLRNEPSTVKFLHWVAEQMGDSKLVIGGQTPAQQMSLGKRMYPQSPEMWTEAERAAAETVKGTR